MMRFDKLTVKAQEAVQAAQSLADQGNHQALEPEHVLLALIQQQRQQQEQIEALQRQLSDLQRQVQTIPGGGARSLADELPPQPELFDAG